MKHIVLAALCVGLAAAATPARAVPVKSAADQAAEKEIRQIEEELRAAFVAADAIAVNRLLPEDYSTTNVNGVTRNKGQLIVDLNSGAVKMQSLTLEHIEVRVYGDAAVLTADRNAKSTKAGTETSGHERMMRVFVKRDGRWWPVAYMATTIK